MLVTVNNDCPPEGVTLKPEGIKLDWIIPEEGRYDDMCLKPGQSLTFEWMGLSHNVNMFALGQTASAPPDCGEEDKFNTEGEMAPYVFNATDEGEFLFVCGVGTNDLDLSSILYHCSFLIIVIEVRG